MSGKEKIILNNIVIEGVAAEGNSIAHVEGKVLFVPQCVPGDVVDVRLLRKRKGYMEGRAVNLVKPSPDRLAPFCAHYGECGGCKWQPLPYPMQLKYKEQQVVDQLTRIGHITLPAISPILGSEQTRYYRNKLEFTFSNKRWILKGEDPQALPERERLSLGFHISGFFDKVLDIERCHLQAEPSNAIRLFVKNYAIEHNLTFFDLREQTGLLRNMIVRTTSGGQVMVIMVFAYNHKEACEALLNALQERFPEITSLYYVINGKRNDSIADLPCRRFSGQESITEKMERIEFMIGPKSFYQTNSRQAYRLYCVVRDFAKLTGDETVYDLYTGIGTIGLFLSPFAKKIVGIEYVKEAIEDARANAAHNGIDKCRFYAGDMKDMLTCEFIRENGHPDLVVLDPPRAGIHPDVAKVLLETAPGRMVYVSCNPASQARDLAILSEKYRVTAVQPVDMFPHTHHVENVVALERI